MKILSIVGARPNFMKISSIADAIISYNEDNNSTMIEHFIVHTGQHYDETMSNLFFRDLGIPIPNVNLGVGSGTHAQQTAEIMRRFEPILLENKPDILQVVGDVNSTIACALVGAKLGIKISHVEAGLRSFDRSMPEEINRILTDAISDVLFTSEPSGSQNLLREGISKDKIHFVGNVMIDTLLKHLPHADRKSLILKHLSLIDSTGDVSPYGVVTLHRPSNVDDIPNLKNICCALNTISKRINLVFPAHPRTRHQILHQGITFSKSVRMIDPLGYLDFLKLMANSRLVLTDSGGIQEETTILGVACLTIRENTERPITVTEGTNILVGKDHERIVHESFRLLEDVYVKSNNLPKFWDGRAGERIIRILLDQFA
jgi:UDP-N-acetylglucosamine 2-epimerase (non-hydrolysing)